MEQIDEILESLGLNKKEVKVYFSLLKTGEETASRISEISELNRVTTYMILKSLKEKGFCSIFEKNKVQFFRPAKPKDILGLLEEKKKKFSAILPLLKQQEKQITEKPEVCLFEGKQGIANLMSILLDDATNKKEVLGYGNISISEKVIQYQSLYWRKTRLERKIKMRAVSDSLGDIKNRSPKEWSKLTQLKTNKNLSKNLCYTIITENLVGLFVHYELPIAILIKNREIAEKERFNFELLWKSS